MVRDGVAAASRLILSSQSHGRRCACLAQRGLFLSLVACVGVAHVPVCARVRVVVSSAAPVGLTRASGALAKADAFAAKPALPVVAAVERKNAATSLKMSCTTARTMKTRQQPHRKRCMLLDKIANNKMTVSFSHRRHHKLQQVNLQWKRVWWEEGNAFVRLRISTKAIKTLKTKSVGELAKRVNLDLNKYKCGGAAPTSA